MIHTCSICGKTKDCGEDDCDREQKIPMNCGIAEGNPYHEDKYLKAIGVRK